MKKYLVVVASPRSLCTIIDADSDADAADKTLLLILSMLFSSSSSDPRCTLEDYARDCLGRNMAVNFVWKAHLIVPLPFEAERASDFVVTEARSRNLFEHAVEDFISMCKGGKDYLDKEARREQYLKLKEEFGHEG